MHMLICTWTTGEIFREHNNAGDHYVTATKTQTCSSIIFQNNTSKYQRAQHSYLCKNTNIHKYNGTDRSRSGRVFNVYLSWCYYELHPKAIPLIKFIHMYFI